MATAAATYTWAAYGTALKAALGISGSSEDTDLQRWLEVATEACDVYLNKDWTDDDGNDITHPTMIWEGIIRAVKYQRDTNNRAFAVTGVKTGKLSEQYAIGTRVKGGDFTIDDIIAAVKGYWRPTGRGNWFA